MRRFYRETLEKMTLAFNTLEGLIAPPESVEIDDGFVFRYRDQGISQALIQKLARNISGLNAIGACCPRA